ncbi:MAG TPA: C25 family cysteine peptidase [Nocardioidaceae bacterium]|nr:C25 family cysteine peptidase [Nocardioidaceae bacterium]
MPGTYDGAWVLVTPARFRAELDALVLEHARRREVVVHEREEVPGAADWPSLVPADTRGVLVVGNRRRSPATVLPGLFVPDREGRPVAAGWVPATPALPVFAAAAAAVQRREAVAPVAVLGQRSARYQRLSSRLVHHLGDVEAVRWGAERITREDVVTALASGLGTAVYLGHGRPSGWAAYRGLRAGHLSSLAAEPVGCLLSLTCWTASRWRVGTSFAEQVVLLGAAAASMGAVRPVLHLDTTRVVLGLAAALHQRAPDVATLLSSTFLDLEGLPTAEAGLFRLCGDPLAPTASEEHAAERARAVFAPAPDVRPGHNELWAAS